MTPWVFSGPVFQKARHSFCVHSTFSLVLRSWLVRVQVTWHRTGDREVKVRSLAREVSIRAFALGSVVHVGSCMDAQCSAADV